MIPIKYDNRRLAFPVVTLLLILVNIAGHIYQIVLGPGAQAFVFRWGAIPWEIVHFSEDATLPPEFQSSVPNILTLLTSMFMHGGFLHLLGNMIYLWIFGDNVESLMGPFRYLGFYICCGLIAVLSHFFVAPGSTIPMVGASGAISGILGAYFIRYPTAKIHMLLILFFFIRRIRIPAVFALGFWFLMQILSGGGSLEP